MKLELNRALSIKVSNLGKKGDNRLDVEFDVNSDPLNPRKIKYDDIVAASRRIVGSVLKSPCSKAIMSEKLEMNLYYKLELLQITGSFKERGVRNSLTMLTEEQKKIGVITATTGNHGIAMSYHATQLGIPCIVVMPTTAHATKRNLAEKYGAKLILYGTSIKEAKTHGMTISKEKKLTYINGYDHPNVIEGQGTIGLEIIEQVPDVEAVLVPCGGGGLMAGIAIAVKHLKPDTEVYGIETDKTCSMVEALRKNERVSIEVENTFAESLGVNMVGVNAFHNIKGLIDKMIVVKEDWVARAIMHVVEVEKFVVEGGGVVGLAAIMAGLFPNLKGKKVVCLLSGGNIDLTILTRALERGMASDGRLIKFKVCVTDRPGGLAELCALLCNIGVIIRDCITERVWVKGNVFNTEIKVLCETKSWEHVKELQEQIKKRYKECFFQEMGDSSRPGKSSNTRRGPCLAPNPVCMQK